MSEEEKYEQLRQVCVSYRNEVADLEAKLAEHNQDKILFAVERLEKLKIELHYLHTDRYLKLIDEAINNQIEELKKEMK